MGIYGMMHTSISGMNAQTSRLSAISDNIANSSTIGYKRSEGHFSTLVLGDNVSDYQSGGVQTSIYKSINTEGTHRATGRNGDLSILGNGFFVVTDKKDGSGQKFLTRAGDFHPDKDGCLRNSAGFYLVDELGNTVNVGSGALKPLKPAKATTDIDFQGSLDFDGKVTGDKISGGTAQSVTLDPEDPKTYNHKTSVTTYGPKGEKVIVDVYLQKKADGSWNACTVVKDEEGKPNVTSTTNLHFLKNGEIDSTASLPDHGVSTLKLDDRQIKIDFRNLSVSGKSYTVSPKANGNESGSYQDYKISESGEVVINLTNGDTLSKGFIALGTVSAVNLLSMKTGTVFQANSESGDLILGRPGGASFGSVCSGQLEESNADIATELTEMIEAQRNFSANSKVFQTGSEVMDIIVNLKR